MVEALRSPLLEAVPHGFLTRSGGVSSGAAGGLQCGFGADDDPRAVRENRRLASEAVLPGAVLVGVHQIHSSDVVVVEEPWGDDERPRADALVTRQPGILLGIVTADCAPVLLADRDTGVVGAAHAGWRGAHGGVLENTVEAMVALGAERARIAAAIGPCIAQPSYEVDRDFRAQFREEDARFFVPGSAGRWQFDLPGYVAMRLQSAGVAAAEALGLDTYADAARFYSYRRATHRSEATYGRLISLVGMAR
ncbi:peptidoglycan editing factor PgeF [Pelagerythrobacter rhizovicinus]|uniref:Purine nucleoside phosphorylase n=1 Tax=Pelagerythrobacter rhizovicinus TaxID=2268576 RepID=A0A4Q2KK77_9SPHN|nr:peptidoglycan editing factor PgeF [Pelagerythrobacter rhizovicinus]RXZ64799.1 peptidoglycan editing factor PgeF [Pelagerythrobacter rhizovicinus]